WTAPEDTVREATGPKPTLTIELPEPALVTGLDITTSLGGLPAQPTAVPLLPVAPTTTTPLPRSFRGDAEGAGPRGWGPGVAGRPLRTRPG
uniref:hypothetical protein n=1 Tax=Nocardia farcinica TaxID=37329 RepID=UPI003CC7F48C